MGIKIFRDDNWDRLKNGLISNKDILGLDPQKDELLIRYIIAHAPNKVSLRCSQRYHIREVEPMINIDDPKDPYYEEYYVLQEQVLREDEPEILKKKAFEENSNLSRFAFCRLTGYSYLPGSLDAYSYCTYDCPQLLDLQQTKAFCHEMIERKGPFEKEAEAVLIQLSN